MEDPVFDQDESDSDVFEPKAAEVRDTFLLLTCSIAPTRSVPMLSPMDVCSELTVQIEAQGKSCA